jgi:hypothetical protein
LPATLSCWDAGSSLGNNDYDFESRVSGMKYLRRRLERIEKRLLTEPILLEMPNGSTERLPGDPNFVLNFMMRWLDGEQVPEVDLIARSASSNEPGGAHMVDMVRLLHSATKRQMQSGDSEPEGK